MPAHNYIKVKENATFYGDTKSYDIKYLYWNNNNEDMALFIDYNKGYESKDRPRVIILPQFRDNISIVEGILKNIAKLYPEYFPSFPQGDWQESDEYYPQEINQFDDKIDSIIKKAEQLIKEQKEKKLRVKEKYKTLRGLLTQTGDEL